MKLRIKGNSLRLRLSRTEVTKLSAIGYMEDHTIFGDNILTYSLQTGHNSTVLSATLVKNKITVKIPASFVKDWADNNIVGFNNKQELTAKDSLFILVEKDFVCLDETTEDQSDNYENPNKAC
ncbi:MAG: hypothetical protein ABIO04_00010 [Ferruginibacter sp.]